MKYLIAVLFITSIVFSGLRLQEASICCSFSMTLIFFYYTIKAIGNQKVHVFIKNLVGLTFVLSSLLYHYGMPEFIAYCVLVPSLIVGYYMIRALFWSTSGNLNSNDTSTHNNDSQNSSRPKYTYTATKNKTTSF